MKDFAQDKSAAFAAAHRQLRDELFTTGTKQKELAAKIGVTPSTLSGNLRAESYDVWQAIVEAEPSLAPVAAVLHFQVALALAGGDPVVLGSWIDKVNGGLLAQISGQPKAAAREDQLRVIRDQLDDLLGGR
jgi:transcriptional regulator with XRE-family HTH domain